MIRLMGRIRVLLHQLRWKLALSYLAVTVGTLIVAVLIGALLLFRTIFVPNNVLTPQVWFQLINENMTPATRVMMSRTPPDIEIMNLMLQELDNTITGRKLFRLGAMEFSVRTSAELDILITDQVGNLLATSNRALTPGTDLMEPLNVDNIKGANVPFWEALSAADGPLQLALAGEKDPKKLFVTLVPDDKFLFVVPVYGEGLDRNLLLGTVIANFESLPTEDDLSSHAFRTAGRSLVLFLIGAGILGAIFGSLTANDMVKRFRRLSTTADAWSRGEFSEYIDDPTEDEIGRLSQRLNGMARQLEGLLKKRQEAAVLEERNRLARELHDSAKQQAFAASAQLGAAVALMESDPASAKPHLLEAGKLVDKVRKELTSLIMELRPVDLEAGGLPVALRDYAIDWAHQNDIEVDVGVDGERPLPLEVEQALFRITQEALANAARHSQAECVEVSLVYDDTAVTLSITDDGSGFDSDQSHSGLGLRSMRERAELIGGILAVSSGAEHGTRVSVHWESKARTSVEGITDVEGIA